MKRCLLLLCFVMLSAAMTAVAHEHTSVLVKDLATGHVLVADDADARRYPASLTKLMTLYLLFDAVDAGHVRLDEKFTVSSYAASQPPTKIGMRPGSKLTAEECIKAIIIKSANDAAVVVAEAMAGSEEAFAQRMTAKARQLGMASTTFRNASGLPNDEQITTANDMATLSDTLMTRFPNYYHYFGLRNARVAGRSIQTHNFFLGLYKGADGLKTGYTRDAGYNLVASAERQGHRLLGVVLGAPNRPNRDEKMVREMNRAFSAIGVEQEPQPRLIRASLRSRHHATARAEETDEAPVRVKKARAKIHGKAHAKAHTKSHAGARAHAKAPAKVKVKAHAAPKAHARKHRSSRAE